MNTSLITILSSDHGRLRREQRDIQKRDLQKALRYGTYERSWGNRWKVEYDGIIFITDNNRRKEVTCYPSPLSLAPIEIGAEREHSTAMKVISMKADLCTSHTVFVVDNSGSMMTHDIPLHRDRQTAAISTMAMEYIAEQIFNESANNRDVVSLIEFRDIAEVIFEREPISWVSYNKLLSRRDSSTFYSRRFAACYDTMCSKSNYLPALDVAETLLAKGNHEDCALSLFFISDGEPTDAAHQGLVPSAAIRMMEEKVAQIATRFDYQLNMSFVGFGGSSNNFSSLQSMSGAANKATGTPLARFVYCDKFANTIGNALTSLAESTTLTRTALMSGERRTQKNTRTDIRPEEANAWVHYPILSHFVYNPEKYDWMRSAGLPLGALRTENFQEADRLIQQNKLPPFLAMNTGYLGTGAERVAYRCHLADENREMKLGSMIAKETFRVDRIEEHIEFHKSFCETQSLAAHLAVEFNKRLHSLPNHTSESTPNISFLKCSVLVLRDPEWRGGARGVLVEKQLDTNRFEWRKWNNNCGAVDGRICHRPMDVDQEFRKILFDDFTKKIDDFTKKIFDIMNIEEGSEEEESSDDGDDNEDDSCSYNVEAEHSGDNFKPSDYLQAFSHFTYLFTNRKVLVCDLQGVYNTDMVPPTFELSDPAVHYRSTKGRKNVFGRTDKGQKGIQLFFNSHKCTGICKVMELSKKNRNWNKQWRRDFAKDI